MSPQNMERFVSNSEMFRQSCYNNYTDRIEVEEVEVEMDLLLGVVKYYECVNLIIDTLESEL